MRRNEWFIIIIIIITSIIFFFNKIFFSIKVFWTKFYFSWNNTDFVAKERKHFLAVNYWFNINHSSTLPHILFFENYCSCVVCKFPKKKIPLPWCCLIILLWVVLSVVFFCFLQFYIFLQLFFSKLLAWLIRKCCSPFLCYGISVACNNIYFRCKYVMFLPTYFP